MDRTLANAIEVANEQALDTARKIEAFFYCVSRQKWLPQIGGISPFDNILEVADDDYELLGAICVFQQLRRDYYAAIWQMDDPFESFTAWQWFASSNQQLVRGFGQVAGSNHHLVSVLRFAIVNDVWTALRIESRFDLQLDKDWVPRVPPSELRQTIERLVFCGKFGGRPLHHSRNLRIDLIEEYDRTVTMLLQIPRVGLRSRQAEPEFAERISADVRTRPMTLGEAAKYLGRVGSKKDCAAWLRNCINEGTIRCESIGRQSHVFDKTQFPETAWPKLLPIKSGESGPKSP